MKADSRDAAAAQAYVEEETFLPLMVPILSAIINNAPSLFNESVFV